MNLPVIDTRNIETTHIPVLDMEIKFKPYTTGQEKTFLVAIQREEPEMLYNNLQALIKDCLITKIDFNNHFSAIDFMKLVFAIRAKSKSEVLNLSKKCTVEGCEKVTKIEIEDIEKTLKIKNLTTMKKLVKITENLSVEVKPLEANYMKNLISVMQQDKKTNEDILDLGLSSIAYQIDKVIYNKKIYTEWTPTALKKNLLENLTDKQLKIITDGTNELISMYFEIPFKCEKCGHKEVLLEENFFALL